MVRWSVNLIHRFTVIGSILCTIHFKEPKDKPGNHLNIDE